MAALLHVSGPSAHLIFSVSDARPPPRGPPPPPAARARPRRVRASLVATAPPGRTVYEVVLRQAALVEELQGRRATKERLRWREEEEEQAELG